MRKIHMGMSLLFAVFLLVFNSGCANRQTTDYAFWGNGDPGNMSRTDKFWQQTRPRSNLVDAYKRLGGLYQKQGKHRKAIAEFQKAIKAKPDDVSAYNSLAISYDALKEYRLSEMAYKDAIALAPEQSYLYNNYGCSSMLRGDRAAAVALFEKAASLDSKRIRIKNNLSMASYGVNKNTDKKEETVAPVPDRTDKSKNPAPTAEITSDDKGNWFTHLIGSALTFLGFTDEDKSVNEDIASVGDTVEPHEKVVRESNVGTVIQVKDLSVIESQKQDLPLISQKSITKATEPLKDKPVSVETKVAVITRDEQVVKKHRKAALQVSNGNGVRGIAARSAAYFREQGQYIHSISDANNFDFKKSIIVYRKGYLQEAYKIALMVPGYQDMKQVGVLDHPGVAVKLILGKDMAIMHFPEIMAQLPKYEQTVTMVGW